MQTTIVTKSTYIAEIIKEPSTHDHEPDVNRNIRDETISCMRKCVNENPTQPLVTSYQSTVGVENNNLDPALLPRYSSVRTMLQRERSNNLPKLPRHKRDIALEGQWTLTADNEPFLLEPTSGSDNDMLIFTTSSNLAYLAECQTIYMDGTFKTCPSMYAQAYSIYGLYNGHIVPLVYVLLSDKTSHTYYRLLGTIRDAVSRMGYILNPQYIMTDFESGIIDAVRQQFPQTVHLGCHFHFGQCIWRKIQDGGLTTAYRENKKVSDFVQKCVALAFVPISEVRVTFDALVELLDRDTRELVGSFIDYFICTWLNGYSLLLWNKYGNDVHNRSNNKMESWHASLRRVMPALYPNIYVYIGALKKIYACTKIEIAKAAMGESPPRRKPKYIQLEQRLIQVTNKHRSGSITTMQLVNKVQYITKIAKH